MGTFGERLQREREMRGITLEEIAAATKISTRSLRALEEQEFHKLPGGVFNKGFVRSYARFLGLDEEQAVADYLTAYEADAAARGPHNSDISVADLLPAAERDTSSVDWRRLAGPLLLAGLAAILLAGGWLLVARMPSLLQWVRSAWNGHTFAAAEAAAPSPATPVAVAPAATAADVESAGAPVEGAPAPAASRGPSAPARTASSLRPVPRRGEFVVQIRVNPSSHLSVQVDGQEIMNGTLTGADLKPIRARQQVVITAAPPSAVQYSVNGQPFRLLGRGSEEQTLTFTPEGIQR